MNQEVMGVHLGLPYQDRKHTKMVDDSLEKSWCFGWAMIRETTHVIDVRQMQKANRNDKSTHFVSRLETKY